MSLFISVKKAEAQLSLEVSSLICAQSIVRDMVSLCLGCATDGRGRVVGHGLKKNRILVYYGETEAPWASVLFEPQREQAALVHGSGLDITVWSLDPVPIVDRYLRRSR